MSRPLQTATSHYLSVFPAAISSSIREKRQGMVACVLLYRDNSLSSGPSQLALWISFLANSVRLYILETGVKGLK
jgi:hypothetical protein